MSLDKDGKCNLMCPPHLPFFCCNNCQKKEWVLWWRDKHGLHDKFGPRGFLGPQGCVLGEDRPPECKKYDCHAYRFYMAFNANSDGTWRMAALSEVHHDKIDREFCDKMNALLEEKQ